MPIGFIGIPTFASPAKGAKYSGGPATIPVEQCITPEYGLPREGSPDSSPFLPLFRLAAYAEKLDAGEVHMSRKITIFLLLSLSYGALLLPQKWQATERRWTDKNNTEQYAGYLLSAAYAERGYCGAKVEIKQAGAKRLFIVDPGQIFHLKEIVVTGLRTFPEGKIMEDAPKPGDVYSAARIGDWAEELNKRYAGQNGALKVVHWGFTLDYADALATIQLTVQERK
jgi:hypothetical protein